jgi:hypothetical protein
MIRQIQVPNFTSSLKIKIMERTEVVLGNVRGEIQLFSDDKKAGKMDILRH